MGRKGYYNKGQIKGIIMQNQNEWRNKFQEMFQLCQDELRKTTEIGKKMLSASKTNSTLHESYEELGVLAAKAIDEGELTWESPRVKELLNKIESCRSNLTDIENEVNNIRFAEEAEQEGSKKETDS